MQGSRVIALTIRFQGFDKVEREQQNSLELKTLYGD